MLVRLTGCGDMPDPKALELVSALAQPTVPGGADPAQPSALRLLNPELLVRLQAIATRFPGRAIEIVSGYRARARATSRHRSGDALDLRVHGVDNEELSIFARTLEQTGVGYYPNSTFVHIDVRKTSAYWVDRSGPGEAPQYVRVADAQDVPPAEEASAATEADGAAVASEVTAALARVLDELHGPELPVEGADEDGAAEASATPAVTDGPSELELAASAAEASTTAEPAESAEASGSEADAAALDAELKHLAERALEVMNRAATAG